MIKQFFAQNIGGGEFEYKTINVFVDEFGGEREDGHEGTLKVFNGYYISSSCYIFQDDGYIEERFKLDYNSYYNRILDGYLEYKPQVYTPHITWGENAHYMTEKELGDPYTLKPGLAWFRFNNGWYIKLDAAGVSSMNTVGFVNATIKNLDTNETKEYTKSACELVYYDTSWEFKTSIDLPKWKNLEIHFKRFSVIMEI